MEEELRDFSLFEKVDYIMHQNHLSYVLVNFSNALIDFYASFKFPYSFINSRALSSTLTYAVNVHILSSRLLSFFHQISAFSSRLVRFHQISCVLVNPVFFSCRQLA